MASRASKKPGRHCCSFHPVKHKPHNQRVAVFRHKLTCRACQKRLRGTVEVTEGDTAVFEGKGWEERLDRNRASRSVAGKRPRPHQSQELPSTQICRVSCTKMDRSVRRSKNGCGTSLCTWGLQENNGSAECLWLRWQPKRPWDSQSKEPCCEW